jgi:hypothetical protein
LETQLGRSHDADKLLGREHPLACDPTAPPVKPVHGLGGTALDRTAAVGRKERGEGQPFKVVHRWLIDAGDEAGKL